MKKYLLKTIGVLVILVSVLMVTGCEKKPFVEDEFAKASNFFKYRGYTYYWEQNIDSYARDMKVSDLTLKLDHNIKNKLIKLDSFGKKTILEDYGNGDIIVYKSKIYTSYAKNDDNTRRTIYSVSTYGSNKKELVDGFLQGRIDNKIIYTTDDTIFYLDADTEDTRKIAQGVNFIGIYKNKIYYVKEFENDTKSIEFGLIDNLEDKGTIYTLTTDKFDGYAESKSNQYGSEFFRVVDDKVYVYMYYYNGTSIIDVLEVSFGLDGSEASEKSISPEKAVTKNELYIDKGEVIYNNGSEKSVVNLKDLAKEIGYGTYETATIYGGSIIGDDVFLRIGAYQFIQYLSSSQYYLTDVYNLKVNLKSGKVENLLDRVEDVDDYVGTYKNEEGDEIEIKEKDGKYLLIFDDDEMEFDLETIMSDGGVLLHEGDDDDLDDYLSWYLYPVEAYLSSYIDDNYKLRVTDDSKPRLFYLGSEIDYYNNSVFVKQD